MSEAHLSAFSPDYASARKRFLEKSEALGARLETIPIDAVGPNGLSLSIDIAQFGAACHVNATVDKVVGGDSPASAGVA